jgi:hypothetical protein
MKPRFIDLATIRLIVAVAVAVGAAGVMPQASRAAETPPRRITSRLVDLGEVHKIFVAQGLAAVVQLPYPITEVKVGSPDDVHTQISKTLPSELTLILKKAGAPPTNLIVRCGLRTFVFDLIPSRKTHQDLVRISGTYGGPAPEELGATLLDSSEPRRTAVEGDMVLIDSSAQAPAPHPPGATFGGTQ